MNFYPFHPGDYMLRTAHLEPIEDLAYRRLLDLYYVNESPMQGDIADIARVIRLRSSVAEVGAVLREFFIETEQGWRHSHCDQVIAQYQAKAKQAAENGKRGGRPRKQEASQPEPDPLPKQEQSESKNNPEETQPVISANPEESGSKTNQEPRTNNQNQVDQEQVAAAPAKVKKFDPLTAKPSNVSADVWTDWVAHRKEIGKRLTETSCKRQAKELEGHVTPDAVITLSITNGWTGLFPEKVSANVRPIQQSRFVNLPPVNADEIRARTAENARLGVRRANF